MQLQRNVQCRSKTNKLWNASEENGGWSVWVNLVYGVKKKQIESWIKLINTNTRRHSKWYTCQSPIRKWKKQSQSRVERPRRKCWLMFELIEFMWCWIIRWSGRRLWNIDGTQRCSWIPCYTSFSKTFINMQNQHVKFLGNLCLICVPSFIGSRFT